jgi:hypothetical protein
VVVTHDTRSSTLSRRLIIATDGLAIEIDGGRQLPIHPIWLRERSREATVFDACTRSCSTILRTSIWV